MDISRAVSSAYLRWALWQFDRRSSAATLLLSVLAAGVAPSVRAQFFLGSFGFQTPAEPAPALSPEELAARAKARRARDLARRVRREQHDAEQRAAAAEQSKKLAAILKQDGAIAAFLQDPTLRSGDILVTQAGIKIFHGPAGSNHSARDFKPLSQYSGANRATLVLLERASGLSPKGEAKLASLQPVLPVAKHHRKHRFAGADYVKTWSRNVPAAYQMNARAQP